jgi:hypothetical protein
MVPVQPQHWQGPTQFRPASLLLVADNGSTTGIVGFWKVEFVLDDGTVIDNGFAQWHSDGTEIMNSSRDPRTSVKYSCRLAFRLCQAC